MNQYLHLSRPPLTIHMPGRESETSKNWANHYQVAMETQTTLEPLKEDIYFQAVKKNGEKNRFTAE